MAASAFPLLSPPAARTHTGFALVWHKVPQAARYQIFLNGAPQGLVCCTDYTAEGLAPDGEYTCFVRALTSDGAALAESCRVAVRTKPSPRLFDVTAYGAVADGRTVNTRAIQAAIDACTPGGVVYIPADTFLTGALFLKSDMTLYIEALGRLQGTADTADYPLMEYLWEGRRHLCYASLINTRDTGARLRDITIAGEGTIDGAGMALFQSEMKEARGKRGRVLCLREVDGLYLKDFTVRNSPSWCVHPILCDGVSMNNIKVYTRRDEYGRVYKDVFNGDGIDPESCRHVYIFHSLIASQDDCIAIKSGRDEEGRARGVASEHIRITNCRFQSGFGVAMGSEMAGGIRHVLVQDCVFENAHSIGSVKAPCPRGGVIEDIVYEDCRLTNYSPDHSDTKWFRGALYIDQFYGMDEYDPDRRSPVDEGTPTIRDIVFRNITVDTTRGNAIFLAGLAENPLKNITLENVVALGKTGLKAYNIDGLTLKNVTVAAREGDDRTLRNVTC